MSRVLNQADQSPKFSHSFLNTINTSNACNTINAGKRSMYGALMRRISSYFCTVVLVIMVLEGCRVPSIIYLGELSHRETLMRTNDFARMNSVVPWGLTRFQDF